MAKWDTMLNSDERTQIVCIPPSQIMRMMNKIPTTTLNTSSTRLDATIFAQIVYFCRTKVFGSNCQQKKTSQKSTMYSNPLQYSAMQSTLQPTKRACLENLMCDITQRESSMFYPSKLSWVITWLHTRVMKDQH